MMHLLDLVVESCDPVKLSLALKCVAIADPASIFLDRPKLVRLSETNTAPVIISGLLMFNSF
jgi:hypothetical protein